MAWQLSAEVTRFLLTPIAQDLTQAERVVLYAIAEHANDDGRYARLAWDSDEWTLEAVLGVTRLRQVLERLAKNGLECRMVRGYDSRDRPIYAHKGKQTTYRLPVFPGGEGAAVPAPSEEEDDKGASSDAPSASTDAPSASTDAPSASTDAPSASTDAPSASTDAPSSSLSLPNSILPVLEGSADGAPGGGMDHQNEKEETTMATEDDARRVLQAVTTGLKTKIAPKEAERLLKLATAALSRLSVIELKAHLFAAKDLNAAASPVGLLVHRLTHLPESSAHRPVRGPSVAHPQHPQPEIDFRTQEEIQLAAETAATAIAAAKEQIRIAREKASAARRGARPARHLHSVA